MYWVDTINWPEEMYQFVFEGAQKRPLGLASRVSFFEKAKSTEFMTVYVPLALHNAVYFQQNCTPSNNSRLVNVILTIAFLKIKLVPTYK